MQPIDVLKLMRCRAAGNTLTTCTWLMPCAALQHQVTPVCGAYPTHLRGCVGADPVGVQVRVLHQQLVPPRLLSSSGSSCQHCLLLVPAQVHALPELWVLGEQLAGGSSGCPEVRAIACVLPDQANRRVCKYYINQMGGGCK